MAGTTYPQAVLRPEHPILSDGAALAAVWIDNDSANDEFGTIESLDGTVIVVRFGVVARYVSYEAFCEGSEPIWSVSQATGR